jgi:hypothetical protein
MFELSSFAYSLNDFCSDLILFKFESMFFFYKKKRLRGQTFTLKKKNLNGQIECRT